jgi:hypothetical protein
MPQLDKYLIFSEIFWFIPFFVFGYFYLYYILSILAIGFQFRNILNLSNLQKANFLRIEKNYIMYTLNHKIESGLLNLFYLEKKINLFKYGNKISIKFNSNLNQKFFFMQNFLKITLLTELVLPIFFIAGDKKLQLKIKEN